MSFGWCTSVYRKLSAIDLDEVFSYQTTKEVRMLDRRLGMVNLLIRTIVIVWVLYVFVIREAYTETEISVGHVISRVNGTSYSTVSGVSRPWDQIDASQPALQNGAAFIATTVFQTIGQTITNGTNPNEVCSSDAQCIKDEPLRSGSCLAGFCSELGWHPGFSRTDTQNTVKHELQTADVDFSINIWSTIEFATLDDTRLFSTYNNPNRVLPYSKSGYSSGKLTPTSTSTSSTLGDGVNPPPTTYTIAELLSLAQTSFDSVKETGCTLAVSFFWNCFVDASSACAPTVQVQRVDLNEKFRGFYYKYANYYRPTEGGPDTRDLNTVYGVRILLSTGGQGKRVSISAIVLQISSGIALLWLANFAADFLMLHVLPERKHYRTYKQERTPDFSDLRNKIAEVEGEKKKLRDRKNRFAAKLDES